MGEAAVRISEKETATEVAISGSMTIENICTLKGELLKAFAIGKEVRISVAGVTEVDVTGLQLLCSCHRTSLAKGVAFSVIGAEDESFAAVSQLAGMWRSSGCDQDVLGTCVWKQEM